MSASLRDHLRREEGSALLSAIILVSVMIGVGLALMAMSDTQQSQAGTERVKDSAFQVGEAALNSQLFQLARSYPLVAAKAYPAACTPASAASTPCPDAANLASSYTTADYTAQCNNTAVVPWTTTVKDNNNGAESYYSSAVVQNNPSFDANGDGAMWVRAVGRSGCRSRSIVQLVRAAPVQIPFPRNVVTANWFSTTNNGKKIIVDTKGSLAQPRSIFNDPQYQSAQPAGVSVRCTGLTQAQCLGYQSAKGQIAPDTSIVENTPSPLLGGTQIESIKAYATALGTYFPAGTCPTNLTGALIFVEDLTPCGSYRGGNTAASPGMLVVNRGALTLAGNNIFYGLIYMRNTQGTSGAVVSLTGTSAVQGAVAVDGLGGISAGSSAANVVFDPRAAGLVKGLGNAAAVPNTWRELYTGQ